MAFLVSLFAWGNLPFTVVLAVAVLFAALQMSGALGLLAGDGAGDAGDADADGDADGDAGGDADGDHGGIAHGVLEFFGVGRVPLTVTAQVFSVVFALAGLLTNTLRGAHEPAASSLVWTVPVAFVVAALASSFTARLLGNAFDSSGSEATTRSELVGRTGVVVSSRVDAEFGHVRVVDKAGHRLWLSVSVRDGEGPISEGREVVVVEYDRVKDRVFVAPLEHDDPPTRPVA